MVVERNFIIKRRITKREKKFFKRNGDLLLQQELNTRQGNVEKTIIFSSTELEKATENFSENRVLGQGGDGAKHSRNNSLGRAFQTCNEREETF